MKTTRVVLPSGLELVPLGRGVWRLCDRTALMGDVATVIAYIERTVNPDGFHVVWQQGIPGPRHVEGLDEIVAMAAERRPRGAERPIPIPHFPPPRVRRQRPLPPVTGSTAPDTYDASSDAR